MTFRFKASSAAALFIAACGFAHAQTVDSVSVFANGAAVGGSVPDSITTGADSVWVEYGNGGDSTGVIPSVSTIVQYGTSGAVQWVYSIPGLVDGSTRPPGWSGPCRTTTPIQRCR